MNKILVNRTDFFKLHCQSYLTWTGYLIFLLHFFVPTTAFLQPNIQSAALGIQTPEQLVNEIFRGSGVQIVSVNYHGELAAIGSYNNLENYIPIKKGIILSTGSVDLASNPNNSENAGTLWNDQTPDEDLASIATDPVEDVAYIEITFIPNFDQISFRYAFASEEYPEFACTDFNDVFGFFLTGPKPTTGSYDKTNIARIPDPSVFGGITMLDIPVSINTINSNGIMPSMGCDYNFFLYHNVIPSGEYPTYDGYIDPFWAIADVIPCEIYTIKIGIADVSDDELDSAIFLEGKSFSGSGPSIVIPDGISSTYFHEGCDNRFFRFEAPYLPMTEDYTFEITLVGDWAIAIPIQYGSILAIHLLLILGFLIQLVNVRDPSKLSQIYPI